MTARPMRVRAIIEVDLPRPPRFQSVLEDDRANALKLQALTLLHEEAMKSFAGGSRAAADFIEAYQKRVGKPVG
jgi:NitT/TauT family transport system ATP-binding protein